MRGEVGGDLADGGAGLHGVDDQRHEGRCAPHSARLAHHRHRGGGQGGEGALDRGIIAPLTHRTDAIDLLALES